jgi:cysteine synthase A
VVEALSTLFQPEQLPGLVTIEVNDADALDATRRLHRLGFPVGPSSGLNYTAAILAMTHFDQPDTRVVTIFPDRMERYFSTELFTAAPRGCG